jgi:hypothetical protein
VPRAINVICDNSMITGYAEGGKPIGPDVVRIVCDEFELRPGGGPVRPANNGPHRRTPVAPGPPAKPADVADAAVPAAAGGHGGGLFAGIGKKRGFSFF